MYNHFKERDHQKPLELKSVRPQRQTDESAGSLADLDQ